MNMIVAYIRPNMKESVVERLRQLRAPGASFTDVEGFGLEADATGQRSYHEHVAPYTHKVKLEVVCSEDRADEIARAIAGAASTGRRGDGKVYVLPVQSRFDIRTFETDDLSA
ncbi:P-II family nitrogen regulator [Longibacter sp.]|uniref:P-II family nitrogen regulator n=1 Tax=Longibacter sp. TaxID=2045415 RepID=UPI003EC0313D